MASHSFKCMKAHELGKLSVFYRLNDMTENCEHQTISLELVTVYGL